MGADGLGCISCHNLYGAKSLGIPAIDLATVPDRIQPSWFKKYLLDPAELRPGTRMPTFFENGKSTLTKVFRGNANQQIEAIWVYLREIDQTRLPVGMEDNENYELVPTDKPIILRTFMKDVGTHAIAVGYPEGVHIAFDALNCRLSIAWRGKFIDAESTWSDRFSPQAKPLNEKYKLSSPGMPIEIAPGSSNEVGVDFRFKGYRLDDAGIPTFLYSLTANGEVVSIEEKISALEDGKITRQFRIRGNVKTRLFYNPGPFGDLPMQIPPSTDVYNFTVHWKVSL